MERSGFAVKCLGQQGFTLIEVLVVCTLLGILSAIAVPKFTNSVAVANTAKVKADLQTLDTAIVMYQMEKGKDPSSLTDLADYVTDLGTLKPPVGKCKLQDGSTVEIAATAYSLKDVSDASDNTDKVQKRAVCDDRTAGAFGK